jgi:hypothetical protein
MKNNKQTPFDTLRNTYDNAGEYKARLQCAKLVFKFDRRDSKLVSYSIREILTGP